MMVWDKNLPTPVGNRVNPSCTKMFGTHTLHEGRGGGGEPTPMISKTLDSTTFNFGRPLGLSMRGKINLLS